MDFWKNTPTEDKGILEVFYNGEWGVICAKKFFEADMRVACRSLGFERCVLVYLDMSNCYNKYRDSKFFSFEIQRFKVF